MAYAVRFEVTFYDDEEPARNHVREIQEIIATTLCGHTHDRHGTPVDLGHANVCPIGISDLDK